MSRASIAFTAFVFSALVVGLHAQSVPAPARTPTIEERTAGAVKLDGYFPLYSDERSGSLWLEIPRFDTDFLYVTGLAAGLGSNGTGPWWWTSPSWTLWIPRDW